VDVRKNIHSVKCPVTIPVSRGVARNLFPRGTKLAGRLGDGRPSAESKGRAPMGVWGIAPRS